MKPSHKPKRGQRKTLLLLAVLALSLSGCANSPQVVPVTPEIPSKPALTTPLPQTPYSTSVQALLSRWQKLLTDTSTTSEPTPTPGPPGTSSPTK